MKKAIITGITGQDGSYLAELLLSKGYEVHGVKRRTSLINTNRIDHLYKDKHERDVHLHLHYGDLTDSMNIMNLIKKIQPDEIYNLAAMSHVKVSFDSPEYTGDVNALGTLRVLEAIRLLGLAQRTRVYQASTSEQFQRVLGTPQGESTLLYPKSPYAVSKVFAYWTAINYREAYGMFVCNGILFNHESPVRGEEFVTKKISRTVAAIALGIESCCYLGNMNAERDWGHAKDYVEAMWLMLQQEKPDDYVIATGKSTSVRDFAKMAFNVVGIEIEFSGEGENELGIVKKCNNPDYKLKEGSVVIRVDKNFYRPTDNGGTMGDASKAREKLKWTAKRTIEQIVEEMVIMDLQRIKNKS